MTNNIKYVLNGLDMFKVVEETTKHFKIIKLDIIEKKIIDINTSNNKGIVAIYYDVEKYNKKSIETITKIEVNKSFSLQIRTEIKDKVFIFEFLLLNNIIYPMCTNYFIPDDDDIELKQNIINDRIINLIRCS